VTARRAAVITLLLTLAGAGTAMAQGKIDLPVGLGELEQRVRTDSTDPAAHYNVALGYWNAKKWDASERELRAAIKLEPRFAQAHLALAFLALVRDAEQFKKLENGMVIPKELIPDVTQYEREYRHAFLIDPLVDLRIVAASQASPDYWDLRDYVDPSIAAYYRGLSDCQEGKYVDCENDMGTFVLAYGNSKYDKKYIPANALWYRGLAEAHNSHFDLALADFNQLMERDSVAVRKAEAKSLIHFPIRTNEHRYFEAVFNHAAGRNAEAIRLYKEAIEHDLSLYIAHVRLAEIYEADKDWDHAIAERHNAVNANPDDPSLQMDLGVTLGRAGKFDEAVDALKAATAGLPESPDAWFWLGVAQQQVGHKAEAKAAFERVIAVAPSRMQARVAQAKQRLTTLQ
jgi:Tfp pilus assembly protein PilF